MQKKKLLILTTLILLSLTITSCGPKKDVNNTPPSQYPDGAETSTEIPTDTTTEITSEVPEKPSTETPSETPQEPSSEIPSETPSETPQEPSSEIPSETPSEAPHEHTYSATITSEATCETDGTKTYTCACGDSYTEPIKATSHNYVTDASTKVEATCTKAGKEADKICSVCGNVVKGDKISKASHSYGEYVYNNDATQTADGTKSRTCSVCGKVDTKTATGTKLPFDPFSLRAITSLDEITSIGTMTTSDSSIYDTVVKNIKAGKYEKLRYIASNGQQFCVWNVRLVDERMNTAPYNIISNYWFLAPVGDKYSDGYTYCNLSGKDATSVDTYLVNAGGVLCCSASESMLTPNPDIPPQYRVINSTECPVKLYEIVETDNMISVWVESTNCGQAGIGTCGSWECTGTCLRSTTLKELDRLAAEKGWQFTEYHGENGRIQWNKTLLVNFYYMKP